MRRYEVWILSNGDYFNDGSWLLLNTFTCPLSAVSLLNEITDKGCVVKIVSEWRDQQWQR